MSSKNKQIPLYAADGRCLGWRSLEAAQKMVAAGFWKPSYGRKGHLKAVWLGQEDGSTPVETSARAGTRRPRGRRRPLHGAGGLVDRVAILKGTAGAAG